MKTDWLKFVHWRDADRFFIGYCPDLFIGGVCHGRDEQKVYRELPSWPPRKSPNPSAPSARCPEKCAQVTMPAAV